MDGNGHTQPDRGFIWELEQDLHGTGTGFICNWNWIYTELDLNRITPNWNRIHTTTTPFTQQGWIYLICTSQKGYLAPRHSLLFKLLTHTLHQSTLGGVTPSTLGGVGGQDTYLSSSLQE